MRPSNLARHDDLTMATDRSQPGPFDDTKVPNEAARRASDQGSDPYKAMIRAAVFGDRPLPPQRLGRFIVHGTLGQGGMGIVLEAYDASLDRKVALKLLHREVDERQAQRMVREAKALAKLSHPNVVQVYEVGETDGRTFIAMELVRGQTLREWQEARPRPGWRACVEVYLQAGRGLAAAHAAGLVHRDFKPGNCIIDDEGRVRVLDFGLVRGSAESSVDERASEADHEAPHEDTSGAPLTRPGVVLGTMAYMPLEQLDGKPADARSDLFSFCVSLYEAVYGERPFDDETLAISIETRVKGTVQPPARGSGAPSRLRRVLLRGLARAPEDRPPSMDVLLAELQRLVAPRTGRRAAIVLGLGLLGASAAAAAWLQQPAEVTVRARCDGAEARLANVWDDGRKQQIEAALLASGTTFGPQTWQRVEVRLDDYSAAWASKYTAACEAAGMPDGPSEADTGRIFACLGERRVALRDTVDVLASADGELVAEAVGLVTKLPGLERCGDVEALRAELPPPEDPVIAAEVELLRERLSKAETLSSAGQLYRAAADVDAVIARAEEIGYAPLLAEGSYWRGMVSRANAAHVDAQRDLERAYGLGVEHEHDRIALRAALALTTVVGVDRARPEQGLQWGQTALALASKPSADADANVDALRVVAGVLRSQGKHAEALEHLRRALELCESSPRDPAAALVLDDMAQVLSASGKLEESLEHDRRALAILEAIPGEPHPDIGVPLANMTFALRKLGRYDEALECLQRDLALTERLYGPDHPFIAATLSTIAQVLIEQGKLDEATVYAERALKWSEGALGPRHPDLLMNLDQLGSILEQRGRPEEALRFHERALAIAEAAYGPDAPQLLPSLDGMVRSLVDQGRLDEALAHAVRSTAIAEATFGPRHPFVAETLETLAMVLGKQGKPDEALEHRQRALAIKEAAAPKSLPSTP